MNTVILTIVAMLVVQNVLRAFPAPDPDIKSGFGSDTPGYKFVFTLARGLMGDLKAVGFDPKSLTKGLVKNGETK